MPDPAAELRQTTEQGPSLILSAWIRTAHRRGEREPETAHLLTRLPPEQCAGPLHMPPRFDCLGAFVRISRKLYPMAYLVQSWP